LSFASLLPRRLRGEEHFRWRGGDVSRLETLSDAVFAFALTLLVVSGTVPATPAQLQDLFWQFPAFALCFAFLIWIWHLHYRFHRRFGFEDAGTVALNGVLLFFVVFYVFPLKYLAQELVTTNLVGEHPSTLAEQGTQVMILYSSGFVGIFLTLTLMYWRAWRMRDLISLDAAERLLTKSSLRGLLLTVGLGFASLLLVFLLPDQPAWSGFVFFFMGPLHAWNGWRSRVELTRLEASRAPAADPARL